MKEKQAHRKKTAAELEEERKRREAEWWNKVIVYYLNQMYHREMDAQMEKYRPKLLVEHVAEFIREQKLLRRLSEKKPGEYSALELLQKMQAFQEEDSPFRDLYQGIKESPDSEEKLAGALSRVVEEAPKRILGRGRRNAVHIRGDRRTVAEAPQEERPDPEKDRQEELRLRYEMSFLRAVMPPILYQQLCRKLVEQGRIKDPEKDLIVRPEERSGPTREEFIERHRVLPRQGEGGLENLDELYTSAAYMLAAYEQRDALEFDEKKADARAMELSGSKAFRSYINSHPGSLLAAAQNTGLEATHQTITELERTQRERDETLASVRDGMRAKASGKSAEYHQLVNSIDRFLKNPDEPTQKQKDTLSMALARYVMTEGDPKNPAYERESSLQAVRGIRALLPEREFQMFLISTNLKRGPDDQITAEKLDVLAARPPEAARNAGPMMGGLGA